MSVTASDYIESQRDLERQARELMPHDPNACTYALGELRQPVFACLTCLAQNDTDVGVCYSCSIQCHASHDLVELFAKRAFVCDCGTTRMARTPRGACRLRAHPAGRSVGVSLDADDVPGSNRYNHNFGGTFCACRRPYNPLEESGAMLQCHFGFECGEDWFHDECILGYGRGTVARETPPARESPPTAKRPHSDDDDDDDETSVVPYFPALDSFDVFVCWRCVQRFSRAFAELCTLEVATTRPHFAGSTSTAAWAAQYRAAQQKRPKVAAAPPWTAPYSVFLAPGFRDALRAVASGTSALGAARALLCAHPYLYEDDPVFCPPDDSTSSAGLLLELGTEALELLPREQALEGLEAYDRIKAKLRDFFRPFAEDGKVVTEEEVRGFFSKIRDEH